MAEVINYVDTDVVGGAADGSSWANAYATLSACENAEDGNWDAANNWLHIYCAASSGTADSTPVVFAGSNCSVSDYILVEATSSDKNTVSHRAVASGWSETKYRLTSATAITLQIQDEFVHLDGLQVLNSGANTNNGGISISAVAAGTYHKFGNLRIHITGSDNYNRSGIAVSDADADADIYNCIVFNTATSTAVVRGIVLSGDVQNVYNCTVYGGTNDGIYNNAGTSSAINCAVLNTGDDFDGVDTISYCASDDNDTTDATNVVEDGGGVDWTGDFTDGSAGDFTLLATSNLVGAGTVNPGAGLFLNDINGTVRGVAWDVGAFEYVAPAGGSSIPAMMAYYQRLRN